MMKIPSASLLLLPLILGSCLGYKEVVLQDVRNIEVTSMDARGVAVQVEAVIENPNNYRIRASDPDVDLFLNGTFIGKGMLDTTLVLQRNSTRTYMIPLHAEFKGGSLLMMLLSGALSGNMELKATGTVAGRAGLIRKRFPFELRENFDLEGN
jgi:LEA14-like dessication related protein